MLWPIIISECKLATDVLISCGTDFTRRWMIFTELGWRPFMSGPFWRWNYPWRWGYTSVTNVWHINLYERLVDS